jgi:hypothetical protein
MTQKIGLQIFNITERRDGNELTRVGSHRSTFNRFYNIANVPRCESCRMFLSVANQPQHL